MTNSSAPDAAPLRVACLSVSAALGGSEWSLLDFARRAAANGIAATVVVPKDGPLVQAVRSAGVPALVALAPPEFLALTQNDAASLGGATTFARGASAWATAIRTALIADAGGLPAVLYSNGFKAHLAGTLVRGPHHVWHLREFPPGGLGIVWRILAGALPTASIANSGAVASAWRMLMGRGPAVVLNGVDLERFRPTPRTWWLHDHLDLPHDARLVGMPAVFARWKGHLQVVEAFERAAARAGKVHLVLVGGAIYDTSAERGFAEELVRRVGRASLSGSAPRPLSDRIHFVKHQAEPWRLYPEFDVVVHFSTRPEPFGRVVAESLASGIPPIAARAGGPMEIVDDGVTGWLVTPGDVPGLADAIVRGLDVMAGDGAEAMRIACRRAAESRFAADRYAAEVAAVLRAAAGAAGA